MQGSVPSPSDVQATFAATLFDEWVYRGLRDVVVCPGSRSTPLALAAAMRPELTLHVRLDERSAGFFALGRALATARPVAMVVTSGTAAAELHAVVCEADQASVGLLVLTADRPPELHGVGAPQTIDQHFLFGSIVRAFEEPGVMDNVATADQWRSIASRLWRAASGEEHRAGPAHLNAAFREPLLGQVLELPSRTDNERAVDETSETNVASEFSVDGARVLCVVGNGATKDIIETCWALHWVVVGDATARGALSYVDPILRDDDLALTLRPDVIIRLGGLPASKILQQRMVEWKVPVTGLLGAGYVSDPDRVVNISFTGLPSLSDARQRGNAEYVATWRGFSRTVAELLSRDETDADALNEIIVARTVVALSTECDAPLVVGSSMPVRDVEWWSPSRQSPTYANRGVNGIDGVVSTVFGVCAGAKGIGLVGDLTFLHDVSGLVDALGTSAGSCVLVVNDNRGGGIFSFLSQANALDEERFEQLFGTPHHHDLEAIAASFGHATTTVATRGELRNAIEKGLAGSGVSVVIAKVPDRAHNVALHDELIRAVRERLGD